MAGSVTVALLLLALHSLAAYRFSSVSRKGVLFCSPRPRSHSHNSDDEYITIEVTTRTRVSAPETLSSQTEKKESRTIPIIGAQSLYEEVKDNQMQRALVENPVLKVLGLVFNPTTLLFAMYFSGVAWSKVQWVQRILRIFGKGTLTPPKVIHLIFSTYIIRVAYNH